MDVFDVMLKVYRENSNWPKISLDDLVRYDDEKDMPRGSGVYAFFNENGDCLYIGCSHNIRSRYLNHRRSTKWFSPNLIFKCTECKDHLQNELRLIKQHAPLYNRPNNRQRPKRGNKTEMAFQGGI